MKFKYFLVCSLFVTFFMSAQTSYKVLYNDGNVFIKDSLVAKGSIIEATDSNLTFKNNKGLLKVCYASCSKIKIISGNLYLKNSSKSIQDYTTYYESMSTRGSDFLNLDKLKALEVSPKIAIVDTLKIPLNYLESDSSKVYYMRVKRKRKDYNNTLKIIDEELIISKYAFATKRRKYNLSSKLPVSIYYYDNLKKDNISITSNFVPLFINKKKFKKDFELFTQGFEIDDAMKATLVRDYFKAYYPNTLISQKELLKLL